jgi:hypothetical protein
MSDPIPLAHVAECDCWRCAELRDGPDYFNEYRARSADPTTCAHPDEDREPHSGDLWTCGHCGADCEQPSAEALDAIFGAITAPVEATP